MEKRSPFDKNVPPNWRPPAGLADRKPGMSLSDALWHTLVSLGGLALMGVGVAILAYLHLAKLGGCCIGFGFVIFILGFPNQSQKNGYRE